MIRSPSFPSILALSFLTLTLALAQPVSAKENPDPWAAFLARYVDTAAADGVNRVRYAAVTPADRKDLDAYIEARQKVKASALPPKERMAFWINLYNAQTVAVVLAAYPVRSILDIDISGPGTEGPWKAKLLTVEGRKLSLDEIENVILRPGFKDPRIHFVLNCASLGCPELPPVPFTAADADRSMDAAARAFVNSPHGAAFEGGALKLSSIFDWYRADFGKDEREVLQYLARYAAPALAVRLKHHAGKPSYRYDWALNAAP
jgi:hypothetical protein